MIVERRIAAYPNLPVWAVDSIPAQGSFVRAKKEIIVACRGLFAAPIMLESSPESLNDKNHNKK
jgi:hypothetical protein